MHPSFCWAELSHGLAHGFQTQIVNGDGMVVKSETWLLPIWTESRGACGDINRDKAMLLASVDMGKTWAIR